MLEYKTFITTYKPMTYNELETLKIVNAPAFTVRIDNRSIKKA